MYSITSTHDFDVDINNSTQCCTQEGEAEEVVLEIFGTANFYN